MIISDRNDVRLAGIDLNLLTALDALLAEQSVTRAARRLGVTQPAVSHALRRLRELLGDDLLVRTPAGMRPTPRALELRPAVRAAIDAADAVLQAAPPFDPRTVERTFVLAMVDQVSFLFMPRLVSLLSREAPGVRFDLRPASIDGRDDVDLSVGFFRDRPAGLKDEILFHEEFVCVIRRGSPAARGRFDLNRYLALPHLLVAPRGTPGSPLDDALAQAGQRRTIVLTVPHFLVAPQVIAGSDLVWTAPSGLARAFARQLPLAIRKPPFRTPAFDVAMRWHVRLDRDPGLAWLRGLLRQVAPSGRP